MVEETVGSGDAVVSGLEARLGRYQWMDFPVEV